MAEHSATTKCGLLLSFSTEPVVYVALFVSSLSRIPAQLVSLEVRKRTEVFLLCNVPTSHWGARNLVKCRFWFHRSRWRFCVSYKLTGSQVMPLLLVQGPHFRQQSSRCGSQQKQDCQLGKLLAVCGGVYGSLWYLALGVCKSIL